MFLHNLIVRPMEDSVQKLPRRPSTVARIAGFESPCFNRVVIGFFEAFKY